MTTKNDYPTPVRMRGGLFVGREWTPVDTVDAGGHVLWTLKTAEFQRVDAVDMSGHSDVHRPQMSIQWTIGQSELELFLSNS